MEMNPTPNVMLQWDAMTKPGLCSRKVLASSSAPEHWCWAPSSIRRDDMHPSETLNWNALLSEIEASPYQGPKPVDPFWFGDSRELSSQLNALVVSGKKRATASLLWEWEFDGDALPTIGQHSALLDWSNHFIGIIRTTGLSVVPFDEVSEKFAALEGEGDLSLEFWRQAHWSFFEKVCDIVGKNPDRRMPVVCQEFVLVYHNHRDA